MQVGIVSYEMMKRKINHLKGVEKVEKKGVWGHLLKLEGSVLLHIAMEQKRAFFKMPEGCPPGLRLKFH